MRCACVEIRLLRDLVDHEVHNPIILSGDIHLAGAAAVRLDYDDPAAPDIAYEIVATSISSGFGDDLLPIFESAVPKIGWLSYANARKRGYAVCTVTAESFTTDFRVVASTLTPTSTVSTDHTIADIKHLLRKKDHVQKGDLVINIASMPIAERGMANMLKVSPA